MLERILKMLSAVILAHHRSIAGVFFVLTLLSLWCVSRLEIKTDLIDVMPHGNPVVAEFKDFMQKYNILETVTVVISSETKTVEDNAALIEALASKLKQSPLVGQVDYSVFGQNNAFFLKNFPLFLDEPGLQQLFERLTPAGTARQIENNFLVLSSPMSSPFDSEFIDRDPLNIREIVAGSLKRGRLDNPFDLSLGYYITKDHSTALLFIKPAGRSKDMDFVQRLKPELDAAVRTALSESGNPRGVSVRLTGGHIFSEEMRQVMRHDIISSTILSAILIALIIWWAYRVRLPVLAVVACTTLAALAMTLAAAWLLFGSLNIVTSIVAVLLIGMYVDYCILTLKRFGDEMLLRNDRQHALEMAMTKAGSAMVVSALNTSFAFFSIIVTRFDGLHELGIVSGIGVLLCLLCTFFLMNSLLVWISAAGSGSILSAKQPDLGMERLATAIERRPQSFVLGSVGLIVLLLAGLANVRFDNDPAHLGLRDSSALAAMKTMTQKLGKSGEPLEVIVRAKNTGELTGAFDRLELRLADWKSVGLIAQADSLSSFLPSPQTQRSVISTMERLRHEHPVSAERIEAAAVQQMDRHGMVYDRERLNGYIAALVNATQRSAVIGLEGLEGFADSRVRRFFHRDDLSMVAYLYPPTAGWTPDAIAALQRSVAREGAGWILVGSPILYDEIKTTIYRGSALAAVMTLSMNLLLIVFFVRRMPYILFGMLPVCLGFLLTPALMGWVQAPFNFINIGTMALIFGIGVDYGVYVMQAYLREDARSVRNALRRSGKNVVICASTTIAGCGSLVFASFAGIASLGLVLTIGSICCSLITLVLLPSMLCLWEQRRVK